LRAPWFALTLVSSTMAPASDLPRSILDNLLEGCQVISPEFRYLYVNDALVRHGKMAREALLGRTMMEAYPGIENTHVFSAIRRCMDERVAEHLENEFVFPDGSIGWFDLHIEPVAEGVVILSMDVTERKRDEIGLRRTMRALTTLSQCNQTLVRATDETAFMQDVCQILVNAGGYRNAAIDSLAFAEREVPGELAAEWFLALPIHAGDEHVATLTICAPGYDDFGDRERAVLEEVALDLGYGIATLRARARQAETSKQLDETAAQLMASQRLEAVGRLAGGIAHDFNNLLTVILTYAGFSIDQLHDSDPMRADLRQVVVAGELAASLTKQLLAFSRKQVMEPRVINVNATVGGIETMLRRLLGEDIDIRVHAAGDLGNVLADPGQLEQVIMNLAVNARDAMPAGGSLTIETANVELDEEYAAQHFEVTPGRYVRLSMADTGTGMDADTRVRIFEPFFTTKEKAKGTGLGLSTVYGIVKQSGGDIQVYSEPGQGTAFKIYLPRVDDAPSERSVPAPPVAPSRGETILLVEDEDAVRKAAERILRAAGYEVVSAATGAAAVAFVAEHQRAIDLLLTDVVMPKMSGRELADRLMTDAPGLKVLFTSGYTDNAIVHQGALDPGTAFLGKPFSPAALVRKVREVLDRE
jgi:PAS domain S-box-containing protein